MDMLRAKQRRLRVNPTHRWTPNETKSLLTTILDEMKNKPDSFEQPTAHEFYKRISAKSKELQGIDVRVYRSKMRNLKTNYIKATWMKREKPQNTEEVEDNIKNICPFWDLLDRLFTQTKRENPQQKELPLPQPTEVAVHKFPDNVADLSNIFIETSNKVGVPIKILGRPRNSSRNIAALSRLIEMHDNKLQFESFKWQKKQKYNDQQLELEQGNFELRLIELEEELEKKKEEMIHNESESLKKIKLKVALLERIKIQELALKER